MGWVLLVAGGLAAAAFIVVVGNLRWRAGTAALVARLRRDASAGASALPAPEGLDRLPPPVARYLRAVLPERPAAIVYARLEQRGEFLLHPEPDGWRPFVATEHFTVPAGFVWDARIRMVPGVAVLVRDGFVAGQGSMAASVMGVREVVAVEATPAIGAAALQRYLAEAVWMPTALLPGGGVVWTPLGPATARATLTAGATTVSVDFHFGEDGLVEGIYTAARERDTGDGRTEPTPWQGHFSRYELLGGFRIPTRGDVEWRLPDGAQPYWRGEVTAAAFET